jgi:hypothetical protein
MLFGTIHTILLGSFVGTHAHDPAANTKDGVRSKNAKMISRRMGSFFDFIYLLWDIRHQNKYEELWDVGYLT